MGQTLTNGIYLPDEGERNSYSGLEVNWRTLDALILTVNGKAAPNVANTWTAEQTFTAGIIGDLTGNVTGNVTGDLTGTASKAIADEDGTSIKTGYGKLAGNNTWTGDNTFQTTARLKNTVIEKGTKPSTLQTEAVEFVDKNNTSMGYIRYINSTDGGSAIEFRIDNLYKDGQVDPTGRSNYTYFSLALGGDGQRLSALASNLRPFHNSSYSLGSSSYQWSSVYAQSYYYNGVEWGLDKGNVWSANQTILKDSEALYVLKRSNLKLGDAIPQSTQVLGTFAFTGSDGANAGIVTFRDNTNGDTSLIILARQKYNSNGDRDPAGNQYETRIDIGIDSSRNRYIRPNSNGDVNLGTSTNKWKTLNGVNPGALSLPDYSNVVSIDTTDWDLTGATSNSYTPTFDGYLSLRCKDTNGDFLFAAYGGSNVIIRNCAVGTGILPGNAGLCLLMPIRASISISIQAKATTNFRAYIIPCLGNV